MQLRKGFLASKTKAFVPISESRLRLICSYFVDHVKRARVIISSIHSDLIPPKADHQKFEGERKSLHHLAVQPIAERPHVLVRSLAEELVKPREATLRTSAEPVDPKRLTSFTISPSFSSRAWAAAENRLRVAYGKLENHFFEMQKPAPETRQRTDRAKFG